MRDEHVEFIFEHDFDEKGLMYYIGAQQNTRMWQNPHSIGKLRAFASSIGNGSVEDLVGRTA